MIEKSRCSTTTPAVRRMYRCVCWTVLTTEVDRPLAIAIGHDCLSLCISDIIQPSLQSHGMGDVEIKFVELGFAGR